MCKKRENERKREEEETQLQEQEICPEASREGWNLLSGCELRLSGLLTSRRHPFPLSLSIPLFSSSHIFHLSSPAEPS